MKRYFHVEFWYRERERERERERDREREGEREREREIERGREKEREGERESAILTLCNTCGLYMPPNGIKLHIKIKHKNQKKCLFCEKVFLC